MKDEREEQLLTAFICVLLQPLLMLYPLVTEGLQ